MKTQLAKMAVIVSTALLGWMMPDIAHGNAISITNLSIAGASGGNAEIQFDLSWSNSWRLSWSEDGGATTITNWDAAWIFIKFKTPGTGWRHATLAASGHTAPAGSILTRTSDGMGALIYRSATGSGSLNLPAVRLNWNYAASGLGGTNDVDISVHAIEMVYIPQGSFALGSGGGESGTFYRYPTVSDSYWVTNENTLITGNNNGNLIFSGNWGFPIPADFPKGYSAFYMMKYEISQGQYASFLNHLDPEQALLRYPDFNGLHRYAIARQTNLYVAAASDRACNYLAVIDVFSYLNWAGLRPASELEYEKACRGTMPPEPNEFAWGSTSIGSITNFSGSDGSGFETVQPASANANYSATRSPTGTVRVGIFAQSGSSRQSSGAGYYGVMELSGNVSELTVSVSNEEGRGFLPVHGTGLHSPLPSAWPGYTALIRRGGAWDDSVDNLRTSTRNTSTDSSRQRDFGGRGVRTAP